jgi:hypothetical protein
MGGIKMKKVLVGLLVIGLLAGCSAKNSEGKSKDKVTDTTTQSQEKKEESKYPFPESSAIGEATIILSTPAGDSSNGNIPVLFVQADDSLIQIGANYENFQGDKQTFIYVDKMFDSTEQIGERAQGSINLSEDRLKVGMHTVTAVQFENDDPASTVINFVEAKYEIKAGK